MMGDGEADIFGARRAGIPSIWLHREGGRHSKWRGPAPLCRAIVS